MIQDIHAHTYFSNCGRDEPEVVLQAAYEGGIQEFGFCDHNYGIGDRIVSYEKMMKDLAQKWSDRLILRCGIEIATVPGLFLADGYDISGFDFCLIEHIDHPESTLGMGSLDFPAKYGCKTGIAHTDLFGWCEKRGQKPEEFFRQLAEAGIFWEMNVSYDSIHNYREHAYVKNFMESEYQQTVVREAGAAISVGFDGHRVEDYRPDRVKAMGDFLDARQIPRLRF